MCTNYHRQQRRVNLWLIVFGRIRSNNLPGSCNNWSRSSETVIENVIVVIVVFRLSYRRERFYSNSFAPDRDLWLVEGIAAKQQDEEVTVRANLMANRFTVIGVLMYTVNICLSALCRMRVLYGVNWRMPKKNWCVALNRACRERLYLLPTPLKQLYELSAVSPPPRNGSE